MLPGTEAAETRSVCVKRILTVTRRGMTTCPPVRGCSSLDCVCEPGFIGDQAENDAVSADTEAADDRTVCKNRALEPLCRSRDPGCVCVPGFRGDWSGDDAVSADTEAADPGLCVWTGP